MASNPYVNKVIYGNNTVMDISDTTAEEGDVAEGKVFYKGSGQRSVGTSSGGIVSHVGMIIQSTTLDTEEKVKAIYGGNTWISLSGYVLKCADSNVTANQDLNDGGADSVTVSSVASHNHTQNSHNHTQNTHSHQVAKRYDSTNAA